VATKKKTPAPRRAGNLKYWRSRLQKLAHDPEALELVVRTVEKLAEISPRRRR
jgi:hypothetical protein